MKKVLQLALGIVTGIGGFLEAGSISTAAQAGAGFGFHLLWAILLGTICLICLVEMAGRFAAVSGHTIPDAVRERFGFPVFFVTLVVVLLVSFLVLASEIGGMAVAMQLATGVGLQWWAIPAALLVWVILWKGTFDIVEQGSSLLGVVSIVFLVGALKLHPAWTRIGAGLLPSLPTRAGAQYWFVAVSIIGASVSPYLMYFYSSGAVEDRWDVSSLPINRAVSALGMTFGGMLSAAVLVGSAMVFLPRGIAIEHFEQLPMMLTGVLGRWGFILFTASLGITCFGAAQEIALSMAYLCAQGFGWRWSASARPRDAARFALVYTVAIGLAAVPVTLGVDPLKLTVLSMALTALSLPVSITPFLMLMNDTRYVGWHGNGWLGNGAVIVIIALAALVAVVAIPLELLGG